VNPHLGHLNGRPNLRQRLQRHIVISPQFGQENLVASWPGAIMWLQLVHVGMLSPVSAVPFAAICYSFSFMNKLKG
jgi:hypothetical protein